MFAGGSSAGGGSVTEHPNVERWRVVREGFARGDIGPALELFAPDVVWTNDEAAGPLAGRHEGLDAVLAMMGQGVELYEGTLNQEVHDTLASDDHVVEVMTERADVRGHHFENRAVYLYQLRDGKVVEVTTLDRDRTDAAAFWERVNTETP
jgi:ketosteroid isomerase-like protein